MIRVTVKQHRSHGFKGEVRENGETKSLYGALGSESNGLGKGAGLRQGWVRLQRRETLWSAHENPRCTSSLATKDFCQNLGLKIC